MVLINSNNEHENWFEALSLWNRVYNWAHYKTSKRELQIQIKSLLVYLWSEKDWLKEQYPSQKKQVEQFINKSIYIKIVGDLANRIKHRQLTNKPRSSVEQTGYWGRITTGRGASRSLYYFLNLGDGKPVEIMEILRGTIDEFEELKCLLSSQN